MPDLTVLYDRVEVLEKTVEMLLSRLNLQVIPHDGVHIELRSSDERKG
jgi:hypothetical protein